MARHGTGPLPWRTATSCVIGVERSEGGVMAKRFGRPSLQYRYEHYDPRWEPTRHVTFAGPSRACSVT